MNMQQMMAQAQKMQRELRKAQAEAGRPRNGDYQFRRLRSIILFKDKQCLLHSFRAGAPPPTYMERQL